jgi:hypothetical protein
MRRLIKAAWLGEGIGDGSALENPSALDSIRDEAAAQLIP